MSQVKLDAFFFYCLQFCVVSTINVCFFLYFYKILYITKLLQQQVSISSVVSLFDVFTVPMKYLKY